VTGTEVGDVIFRNAGHFEVDANQSITVYGSWSNGYAFSAGTGSTVEFRGTNTATILGSQAFAGLSITNGGKRVEFAAGDTNGVLEHLTLTGYSGNLLTLRSSADGQQTFLNVGGAVSPMLEYLDIKDNNADPGIALAVLSSTDSLNNSNWSFAVAGQTNTWIGTTNTSWANSANWTLGRPPIAADASTIISNGTFDPLLPSARTFNRLEVYAGATLGLNGFDLTVKDAAILAGTVNATGAETLTFEADATISGGLTLAGTEIVYLAGDVNLSGSTLTEASSHVFIDGSAAQTVTSGGQSFYRLTVTNQSGVVTFADAAQATFYRSESASVTFSNSFTATQFCVFSDNGSVTQTFRHGSTYAVEELYLLGSSNNTIYLQSAASSAWFLNVSSAYLVQYVDVEYSDASGGREIAPLFSVNSGNNANWSFGDIWRVWTGAGGSSYHTASSWNPSGVPDATNRILINDADTCTLSSPAQIKHAIIGGDSASLMQIDSQFVVSDTLDVIANGTLEVNDDPGLTVSNDMNVTSGGTMTHKDNSTTEADKLVATIVGDLTIAAGGAIDVTGLGYNRSEGPGQPNGGSLYSGGGHGGRGGLGYATHANDNMGKAYGSLTAPTNLGSGGSDDSGGTGGGAVCLTVGGTVTLNGDILAEGGDGIQYDSGAGGSVFITTADLAGSGTISVNGGLKSTSVHGAGGGGRIAVVLTNGSTFGSVTMTAHAGGGGIYGGGGGFPGAGTVYTKTPSQTYGTVTIDNNGAGLRAGGGLTAGTWIPTNQTWQVDTLELVDSGSLWVDTNSTLNLASGDFGNSDSNGNLIVLGTAVLPSDLTVSNFTFMPLWGNTLSGLTNLTIASGGRASHVKNNDDTAAYKLKIDIPGNLTIEAGAAIDVTGDGYARTDGPGAPTDGYYGGSHGGVGGDLGGSGGYGDTYGSVLAPTNAGSGSGGSGHLDTAGGGVVRLIIAGTTTVDGEILADGGSPPVGGGFNGGAGGSIYLTTADLAGSGTIRAAGGESAASPHTGSGGGGRIAVIMTSGNSFGSVGISTRGGLLTGGGESAPGTVYLERSSESSGAGRVIIDRDGGNYTQNTYLPPQTNAVTDELIEATIIVTNANTELTLASSATVGEIYLYTNTYLVLSNNTLFVDAREHHLGSTDKGSGDTNRVDHYNQIIWVGQPSGMVIQFR